MSIDTVIAEMYGMVSFVPGTRPDWTRQSEIFAPNARLVRVNDDGVFEFTPETFRQNFESMIDSGVLPSFWEREIWRETHQFANVAHVLSADESPRCFPFAAVDLPRFRNALSNLGETLFLHFTLSSDETSLCGFLHGRISTTVPFGTSFHISSMSRSETAMHPAVQSV